MTGEHGVREQQQQQQQTITITSTCNSNNNNNNNKSSWAGVLSHRQLPYPFVSSCRSSYHPRLCTLPPHHTHTHTPTRKSLTQHSKYHCSLFHTSHILSPHASASEVGVKTWRWAWNIDHTPFRQHQHQDTPYAWLTITPPAFNLTPAALQRLLSRVPMSCLVSSVQGVQCVSRGGEAALQTTFFVLYTASSVCMSVSHFPPSLSTGTYTHWYTHVHKQRVCKCHCPNRFLTRTITLGYSYAVAG